MYILFDVITIMIGFYLFIKSYSISIDPQRTTPVAFIQMVIFVFNILPLLFNYLFGLPTFQFMYWYIPLLEAMREESVNIIYDLYIIITMIALHIFVISKSKFKRNLRNTLIKNSNRWFFDSDFFWLFLIALPFIYIILSGQFINFLSYGGGLNGFTTTVASNNFFNMYTYILLSCFGFCMWYFRNRNKYKNKIILILYSFLLMYICGKRYVLAIMTIMYLFFYVTSDRYTQKTKTKLEIMLPILGTFILLFSCLYLILFKETESNMYVVSGLSAIYDTLRVDFGRDDVTKYVIYKELFLNEPILEYPGESFLSLLFIFIPRAIWASKPYQHYQYLTSSILNWPIDNLPAGTTPSWFEMCIANFHIFGFFVGVLALVYFSKKLDNCKSLELSGIYMMLMIALLTQGLDAYVGFIAIILIVIPSKLILKNKKIVLNNGIQNEKNY